MALSTSTKVSKWKFWRQSLCSFKSFFVWMGDKLGKILVVTGVAIVAFVFFCLLSKGCIDDESGVAAYDKVEKEIGK